MRRRKEREEASCLREASEKGSPGRSAKAPPFTSSSGRVAAGQEARRVLAACACAASLRPYGAAPGP